MGGIYLFFLSHDAPSLVHILPFSSILKNLEVLITLSAMVGSVGFSPTAKYLIKSLSRVTSLVPLDLWIMVHTIQCQGPGYYGPLGLAHRL